MNVNMRNLLIAFIEKENIVSSWGITNITVKDNFIIFDVNGFAYTGKLVILCSSNYYIIYFNNGKKIECGINKLIDLLDSNIERVEDYQIKLKEWIELFI